MSKGKISDTLLQTVEKYIQKHYTPESGIRWARQPDTSDSFGKTGRAIKNIISTMLNLRSKTFSERLIALIDKRGCKPSDVYTKAGITKQHFSKIKLNTDYQPSKETALAFAIVLKLSLAETKDLIGSAGFTLSHSSRRDLAVECLIREKVYNLDTVNAILYELGFEPLTNRRGAE
ncbi:MAG: helix-turn-helix transcriptional regulator [Selenomonadaceae bacterium]|nr:helix-turn-helix transcriptional regulator [Selenomonadaceae bacterium]